ncbi:hypothetical protein TIFTF001_008441 [Ficus carica]|uniref:Uncharacterized protein n=1 Tax=Ficus carica TaxID=3494 RepID=A0AA87ZUW0_FICCA|nr:hypothetical protein TIFTF001_008441 [Ficus carica]
MCTQKYSGREEKGATTFIKLRHFVGKLRKRFSLLAATKKATDCDFDEEELEVQTTVPDDVKEGHFAVVAVNGAEKKRFIVKIDCLNNSPTFQRLLEQAEEEYGFEQTGPLVVPCRPDDLDKILSSTLWI